MIQLQFVRERAVRGGLGHTRSHSNESERHIILYFNSSSYHNLTTITPLSNNSYNPTLTTIPLTNQPTHLTTIQAIDELFNANQVNLQLMAVTPAVLSLFLIQWISRTLLAAVKSSSRGRLIESASVVHRDLRYGHNLSSHFFPLLTPPSFLTTFPFSSLILFYLCFTFKGRRCVSSNACFVWPKRPMTITITNTINQPPQHLQQHHQQELQRHNRHYQHQYRYHHQRQQHHRRCRLMISQVIQYTYIHHSHPTCCNPTQLHLSPPNSAYY